MTEADTDDGDSEYRTIGVDATPMEGYGAVELDDGELIVYDVDDEDGWIQSSDWIGLEFMA